MDALLKGALIGLSVAAPPGPNALMCMSRTLSGGRAAGLRCGLGAASAHALYAAIAVLGVDWASAVLVRSATPVRVLGGLLLVGLGIRLWMRGSSRGTNARTRAYGLTLAVGLANPLTILYFTSVMALGTVPADGGPVIVGGVFAGSAVWWAALTSAVARLGDRLDERRLVIVNRLAASAITAFGLVATASAAV